MKLAFAAALIAVLSNAAPAIASAGCCAYTDGSYKTIDASDVCGANSIFKPTTSNCSKDADPVWCCKQKTADKPVSSFKSECVDPIQAGVGIKVHDGWC